MKGNVEILYEQVK